MAVLALARAAALVRRVAGALGFLAPLLTRLVIGLAFVQTGRGKLEHFENTVAFFTDLGIPFPELNAAFIGRLEYWGGMALLAGLLTRLVAAGLLSTMVVAILTADRANFLKAVSGAAEVGLTDVTPVVFGLFLIWLVLQGAGAVSADRVLSRALKLEGDPPAAT